MAALKLQNLPRFSSWRRSRFTSLQALLLLGGAFVLAVLIWFFTTYRLVTDPAPMFTDRVLGAITFVGNPAHTEAFIASLPEEPRKLLEAVPLKKNTQTTLFAYRANDGAVSWGGVAELDRTPNTMSLSVLDGHYFLGIGGYRSSISAFGTSEYDSAIALSPMSHPDDPKPRKRWIKRSVQAFGFFDIGGTRQPVFASFEAKNVRFEVGRAYRGFSSKTPVFGSERRLITPVKDQIAYLEKPPGASWEQTISILGAQMQRLGVLTEPWTWPGRVELAISGSATEESLRPFVLYHRPAPGHAVLKEKVDVFAKNLLSEASPETIQVRLPDDSHMTELRHDPAAVQSRTINNRFGQLIRLTSLAGSPSLSVFHADIGETWISNDLELIQAALVSSIGSKTPDSSCQKSGPGGFASLSGQFFKDFGRFKLVNVSIKNLETGLFTLCGYY